MTRYRLAELHPCVRYLRAVLAVVPARVTRHAREAYIRSKVGALGTGQSAGAAKRPDSHAPSHSWRAVQLHEEDWHTMQVHSAGPLEKVKAFISAREKAGAGAEQGEALESQQRVAVTATPYGGARAAGDAAEQPRRSESEQRGAVAPVKRGGSGTSHRAARATRKRQRREDGEDPEADAGASALYCSEAENVALAATPSAGQCADRGDDGAPAPSRRRRRRGGR